MIFLSAQPDDFYFTWQLELQIFNFRKLGIKQSDIHILIGYNPRRGLRAHFKQFIQRYDKDASFFLYPDLREGKTYAPSIRPNIIKQHLKAFPNLTAEGFFYHDSDVLLREIPDFALFNTGKVDWYVSDAASYLNIKYLKSQGGVALLRKMARTIGVDLKKIIENDNDAGGAQYIIKNTSFDFWDKVEHDCEKLYGVLEKFRRKRSEKLFYETGLRKSEYKGIQSWCTDMWVLLWNAWEQDLVVKIHKELDFCWTQDHISDWETKKILHYSGVIAGADNTLFSKGSYTQFPPFHDNLSKINSDTCSKPVVDLIAELMASQLQNSKRIDINDVTFIMPVKIDSLSRLENLLSGVQYLNLNFETKIIIAEYGTTSKIPLERLPLSCQYFFVKHDEELFHRTKAINDSVKHSKTEIIAIWDADVVIPPLQVLEAVEAIRSNQADCVSPYDGSFVNVSSAIRIMFTKFIDLNTITKNRKKISLITKRSWGGALILKSEVFLAIGGENEYLESWGPDDIERVQRLLILGYRLKRIKGELFHLEHPRPTGDSSYDSVDKFVVFMSEYYKISNMNATTLKNYIETWPWIN